MQGDGASACAQTVKEITVGSRKILIGKLSFRDFTTAKEMAAEDAKRSLIQTYTKNPDLVAMLPKELQQSAVQDAFSRAEKITADNLPKKMAWLPKRDSITGKAVLNTGERFFHKEANQWIDKGKPLLEDQEIEYSGWWLSQTQSGQMCALWLAARKCKGQEDWTLDYVSELIQDDTDLDEAANAVGELSQQRLGN